MNKFISLLAATALLGAGNAQAFDWFGGRLSLGGGYGRSKPELPSSYKESDQDGQMWTVNAKYFLNDRWSLVGSYADMQPYNRTTGLPIRFRPIIGSVRFNLFQGLPITPYVTAGAGVSINKKDVPDEPSVKWEKLALQGGVGFEFFINQGTALGVETLYHSIMAEDSNVPYRLVSLVGTMSIYFGEGPATAKARADAEKARADAEKSAAEAKALADQNQAQQAQADAAKAEADRKAQELQAQAQQAQAEMDNIKQMISQKNLAPVNFKTGSAELLVESHAALDKVAETAKKYPNLKLRVEGHTDSQGDEDYNLKLSQNRADAVRDYLVNTAGLPADQVVSAGFGKTRPIASNDTASGRSQNRRVEFIFLLEIGGFMNEINKARHSVEKNADRANDVFEAIQDKGEELLEEVKERGNKLWDKAQDRGEDAWKDARVWISKHPGAAVGYAFLVGALLHAFIGRNED